MQVGVVLFAHPLLQGLQNAPNNTLELIAGVALPSATATLLTESVAVTLELDLGMGIRLLGLAHVVLHPVVPVLGLLKAADLLVLGQ